MTQASAFSVDSLFALFDQHRDEILRDFFDFLRIETISSEPKFHADVLRGAHFVSNYLADAGFSIEHWETSGYPVVFASWNGAGPDAPTLLLYGHYDVQPVDPLELWESPPFEPQIRDGEIYARGAQDNKGQIFYTMAAVSYLLRQHKSLPVNVKIIIEGEEEIGSPGLAKILPDHKTALQADSLLIIDVGIHSLDAPSVTVGMRGIVTMTVTFTGSNTDLHSGSHGGIVFNPNHALVEVLASLRDARTGKVKVPGFYDDVLALDSTFQRGVDFDYNIENYKAHFGTDTTGGEKDYSPIESAWLRPTLEINGLGGGYSGDGFKTVIPAKSVAKISCRLVPNQDPKVIAESIQTYIEKACPEGVQVQVTIHPGYGPGTWTNPHSPIVEACARAYSDVFQKPCKRIMEGATIPISTSLASVSHADLALIGYGLPGDRIHAPNEHFGIERLRMGFATIGRILYLSSN